MKKILLVALVCFSLPLQAQMYKCKDANGKLSFQDRPCKSQKQEKLDRNGKVIKEVKEEKVEPQKGLLGKWINTEDSDDVYTLMLNSDGEIEYHNYGHTIRGTWTKLNETSAKVKLFEDDMVHNGTLQLKKNTDNPSLIFRVADERMTFQRQLAPQKQAAKQNRSSKGLSQSALQGKWRVIEAMGIEIDEEMIAEMGEDIWTFKRNKYSVTSAGRTLGKPETFSIKGNSIVLSQFKIEVLEFNGKTMVVDTLGIEQVLERK